MSIMEHEMTIEEQVTAEIATMDQSEIMNAYFEIQMDLEEAKSYGLSVEVMELEQKLKLYDQARNA